MSQDPLGTASRLATSVSHALGQLLDVIRAGSGRSMEFRMQTMVLDMDIILVVPLDIITHFTAIYLSSQVDKHILLIPICRLPFNGP